MKAFSDLEQFDRRFLLIIFGALGAVITITTIIHHLFPFLIQVPTVVIPFILPAQLRLMELLIWDLSTVFLSVLLYYHVAKKHGILLATFFLTGSIIFTGFEGLMWILGGRFGLTNPTYFFSRGGLWFFEIPLYACLGWFIIAYSSVYAAEHLFKTDRIFWSAFLGGIFAVMIDLWMDPIYVNLGAMALDANAVGLWVWEMQHTLEIFSIPFMNFLGWFLVVFLFAYLWEKIREAYQMKHWSKRKCTLIFYGCIPLLLLTCLVVLGFVEIYIIQPFFHDLNILPVGGP